MPASVLLIVAVAALAGSGALAAAAVGLPPTARERIMLALAPFGRPKPASEPEDDAASASFVIRMVEGPVGALGPRLITDADRRRLQRMLNYAGNPGAWPLRRLIRMRGFTLMLGAAVGLFLGTAWFGTGGALLGPVAGAVLGLYGPDLLVLNAGQKRQTQLAKTLPDVLDALVIGVEAGLGLDAAMAQVAQYTAGPMPSEIYRILQEMRIGVSRAAALRALADRTTVKELRAFVTALIQSGELGIPIAGVLREHAGQIRLKRRQRAEEQAQKVPVKILFPVLFCLFPAMFVVILGPGILSLIAAL